MVKRKLNLEKLKDLLKKSWSKESSAYPESWTPKNPAWGQCLVTALLIQDYKGGKILEGKVKMGGKMRKHFWNELPGGKEFDFTKEQFSNNTNNISITKKEEMKSEFISHCLRIQNVRQRYFLLKSNFEKLISMN